MGNIGVALNGGQGDRPRKKDDFYATPGGTVRPILHVLHACFPDDIWEPCCGEGDMSEVLKAADFNVVSTDLVYRGYGRGGVDFLKTLNAEGDAIVTNPPFNLADEIIEHALCVLGVEHLALILPGGFWHSQEHARLYNTFRPQFVLPCTWRIDNTGEGRPTMNVQWCIWTTGVVNERVCFFAPLTTTEKHPGRHPADDPLR